MSKLNRFAVYAWGVLAYTLLVILWGAFVRATGSGAGCGEHWPLCNGEIIPRAPQIETLVELSHRITTSLSGLLVIGLVVWAFRSLPKGHATRAGAVVTLFFILLEGAVGAIQVKLGLTGDNASTGRAWVGAIHLINTFFLLAAMTLTAWWASGGAPVQLRGRSNILALLGVALFGTLLLGASGAITALGDTLFPAESLAHGFAQDMDPQSHFLIQLRWIHPALAVGLSVYVLWLARYISRRYPGSASERMAQVFAGLFLAQLCLGALNIGLLAPVWMQLIHLLMADALWIALVLLSAVALAAPQPTAQARTQSAVISTT